MRALEIDVNRKLQKHQFTGAMKGTRNLTCACAGECRRVQVLSHALNEKYCIRYPLTARWRNRGHQGKGR